MLMDPTEKTKEPTFWEKALIAGICIPGMAVFMLLCAYFAKFLIFKIMGWPV